MRLELRPGTIDNYPTPVYTTSSNYFNAWTRKAVTGLILIKIKNSKDKKLH